MTNAPTPDYQGPPPSGPGGTGSRSNGLSVAALICGIAALVVSFIPCVNFLAWILILVTLGLGIAGWVVAAKDPNQKPLLAIIGIALAVLAAIAFFVVYAVLGAGLERYGGEMGRWGITTSARQQADFYASQAREQGVDEQVITDARAELDQTLEGISSDIDDFEQANQEVDEALQQYRQTLEEAAGTQLEPAPDDGGGMEELPE